MIKNWILSWSWEARCRNADVARILQPMLSPSSTVLDAGSGDAGLAAAMRKVTFVSLDILAPKKRPEVDFIRASIVNIPFADRAFAFAGCVDTLEHMPDEMRDLAISELVRVSKEGVVIAFPTGRARQVDEAYARALKRMKEEKPEWLVEHLTHQYPDVFDIITKIQKISNRGGRSVVTQVYYSEPLRVAILLRALAVQSSLLYSIASITAGLCHRLIPTPSEQNSYRAIVVSRFH